MTRPILYVYETTGRTVVLRSPTWAWARDWLTVRRIPAQWAPADRGWHVRADRVEDLVVMARNEGIQVRPKGMLS